MNDVTKDPGLRRASLFRELIPGTASPRGKLAAIYGALALLSLAVATVDPAGSRLYPRCQFHEWTGWHCPGCGGLRATHQLLRGHVLRAFGLNPLLFVVLPFLAYPILSDVVWIVRGRGLRRISVPARVLWVLVVLTLLFWILRNIPVYPFHLLAP